MIVNRFSAMFFGVLAVGCASSFGGCKKDTSSNNSSGQNTGLVYTACSNTRATVVTTIANGNWDNPSIWSTGVVPEKTDELQINHNITFPNTSSTQTFFHKADITIALGGNVTFNTNPDGSPSGYPFEIKNADLTVEGSFTTNEDVVLNSATVLFGLAANIYVGDDLQLRGNTIVTNNSAACGSFSIGDDIYLYGTSVLLNGSNNIALGQDIVNGTPTTPGTTGAAHIALFNNASLSQIQSGVVYNCSLLPLTLISYEGDWVNNTTDVKLKWSTGSEINVDRYIIKQLSPCEDFKEENFVNAGSIVATGNNASSVQQYNMTLPVTRGGDYYYRLYEQTMDGDLVAYETIRVRVGR